MKRITINNIIIKEDFKEFHSIIVFSSIERCWWALQHLEMNDSKLIKLLFFFRGLKIPKILNSKLENWSQSWLGLFYSGFHPIVIKPPKSLVLWLGLTSPKNPNYDIQSKILKSTESYLKTSFQKKKLLFKRTNLKYLSNIELGWDFQIFPFQDNKCIITTETRIFFHSQRLKNLFLPYWLIIRIFSGVIRREILRIIRNNAVKKEFLEKS